MKPKYKYREDELLAEFADYIDATYGQHYSRDKFQATEFIIDGGHGTGFCIGNVMKYAQRYGKKGDHAAARKDLLKVLHYALIQLYIHDEETAADMAWDAKEELTPDFWDSAIRAEHVRDGRRKTDIYKQVEAFEKYKDNSY
jgi:hypothetical protein